MVRFIQILQYTLMTALGTHQSFVLLHVNAAVMNILHIAVFGWVSVFMLPIRLCCLFTTFHIFLIETVFDF